MLASSLLVLGACGTAETTSGETTAEATKRIENAPVNCATAEDDLRILTAERERAEDNKLQGLMAISPAGIVIGAATGTHQRNVEMLTGEYIRDIDQKIAEIRATCGL